MSIIEACPHCGERTEIEVPECAEVEAREDVEYRQDCDFCALPIVGVFKVEFVLQEVRPA